MPLTTILIISIFLSIIIFITGNFNTTEGLTTQTNDLIINGSDAFCKSHEGSSHILEKSCGRLTENNCNSTSCCIWTSNKKCVAGGVDGATFNTDENGKTINLDYYYYKNKCYGEKCQ